MKKVFVVMLCLVVASTAYSARKGRRVHLGHYDVQNGAPKPHRSFGKELLSLYQEETILHVNSSPDLLLTITFKDEEDNILSQTEVSGEEIDVEIPSDATIVEVCYNSVELVGMLY